MPIVSEKNVGDALTFLALGGEAEQEAAHLAAEQKRHLVYSRLYLGATGSIPERECMAIIDVSYQAALTDENAAKVELTRAKNRKLGAAQLCDIWRTETYAQTAAEKVR
jgi:hypothetical protein